MTTRRAILAIAGAVAVLLTTWAPGQASASRQYLTFNIPVALPGVTLARGTYTFERLPGSMGLVRVSSRDGRLVYLTAFTHEVRRPQPHDTRPVIFGEAATDTPPPVRVWFPEGRTRGHEFIYEP